ncbi:MAG: hypothetical protein CM1200mP29_03770 [Verrucomicrobiota bacterium]|nr:MAG: hypothetical protein CM1200mP29_03770 [Verrucomicrobiota bacterium]
MVKPQQRDNKQQQNKRIDGSTYQALHRLGPLAWGWQRRPGGARRPNRIHRRLWRKAHGTPIFFPHTNGTFSLKIGWIQCRLRQGKSSRSSACPRRASGRKPRPRWASASKTSGRHTLLRIARGWPRKKTLLRSRPSRIDPHHRRQADRDEPVDQGCLEDKRVGAAAAQGHPDALDMIEAEPYIPENFGKKITKQGFLFDAEANLAACLACSTTRCQTKPMSKP